MDGSRKGLEDGFVGYGDSQNEHADRQKDECVEVRKQAEMAGQITWVWLWIRNTAA